MARAGRWFISGTRLPNKTRSLGGCHSISLKGGQAAHPLRSKRRVEARAVAEAVFQGSKQKNRPLLPELLPRRGVRPGWNTKW